MDKIYIHEDTGTVYFIKDEVVMYCPMGANDVVNFAEAAEVTTWEHAGITETEVREALA